MNDKVTINHKELEKTSFACNAHMKNTYSKSYKSSTKCKEIEKTSFACSAETKTNILNER